MYMYYNTTPLAKEQGITLDKLAKVVQTMNSQIGKYFKLADAVRNPKPMPVFYNMSNNTYNMTNATIRPMPKKDPLHDHLHGLTQGLSIFANNLTNAIDTITSEGNKPYIGTSTPGN